ncbi:hypothetical protein AB0B88_15970 [Micromonospora haikouensis]|uniref:hypothetical protein n=1 Tax=Micromonospora haikouensis TaxID=686309 RepID=UPI0033E7DD4E
MMSVEQVRNRLILAARVIITDHWPRPARPDWCPICHCDWQCFPTVTAYAYLRDVGRGRWIPPHISHREHRDGQPGPG